MPFTELECDICNIVKPVSQFTDGARHNVANKNCKTRCFDCVSPVCSVKRCTTCKICRDPKCPVANGCVKTPIQINPKHLPKTANDVAKFRCAGCKSSVCDVCGDEKPLSEFGVNALHNIRHKNRKRRCLDCTHPPCTAAGCTTCKVCRNVECKIKKEAVNGSQKN